MSNIFDDHIGDIQPIALETNKPKATDKVDSTTAKHKTTFTLKTHRLPDTIKTKIDKLVDLMAHKDNDLAVEKVEYKIAKELFAMLPEYISAVDVSKLTRNPSQLNASLLREALSKNIPTVQEAVVAELHEYFTDLYSVYQPCKADIQYVLMSLKTFSEVVQPKLDKVTNGNYLVMIGKDTYDLRETNLEALSALNLQNIDYEPLRQQLPGLLSKLVSGGLLDLLKVVDADNVNYGKVYTYCNVNILDILRVCGNVANKAASYTDGYTVTFNNLEETYQLLCTAYCDKTVAVSPYILEKAYSLYGSIANTLVKFIDLKTNIDSDNSVLDAISQLLDLLGSIE
jgi:hypothetical protein